MDYRIPIQYTRWPIVESDIIDAVTRVASSGQWHYGSCYLRLEEDFSSRLGRPVVVTSSCAWAIFLSLRTIGTVYRVAAPAYTYHGTVHPILWSGAKPIFVDVDPHTFNMCPYDLRRVIMNKSVDAVIAVHIHGMPFDHDIVDICKEAGIFLIEDACQSYGATLQKIAVGCLGDAAAFSFNSRKTLPAGLGGAVAFKQSHHSERAKELRNYGKIDNTGLIQEVGYYLPMSEFDAAIVQTQLPKMNKWIEVVNGYAKILNEAIPNRAPYLPADRTHTWHKYRIRGTKEERSLLTNNGILTSDWISVPLPLQPVFAKYALGRSYPGAEEVCRTSFCLFDDDYPLVAQTQTLVIQVSKILSEVLNP